MWLLIITLVVIVLIIFGLASYEDSHAAALQAQAAIEASRATQIAVGGQAVVSVLLAVIVLLLILIVSLGFFLWLRAKQTPIQHRDSPVQQLSVGQTSVEALNQMQQILTLQLLARLIQPPEPLALTRSQPAELDSDEALPWLE